MIGFEGLFARTLNASHNVKYAFELIALASDWSYLLELIVLSNVVYLIPY